MLNIHYFGKKFYCPVKKNRLARKANSTEFYKKTPELDWTTDELKNGKAIRLKGMPRDFLMRIYRVPVSTNRTDYVVTNDSSLICTDDVQKVCAIRWYIEPSRNKAINRSRKCRIQRNHIACAMLVWSRLKQLAYKTNVTIYQLKKNLLTEDLIKELKAPRISMSFA